MTAEITVRNKIIKIDTNDSNDREILGNYQQEKLEEILKQKGFFYLKAEEYKYSSFDYYQERDNRAVIIELKTTTKNINTFDTELINISKIQGIYKKVEDNRKKGIKSTVLIIYSYINNNEYRILKVKWDDFKTFTTRLIFNKEHYLIPKGKFEPFDKIDEYLKYFKIVVN